MPHVLDIDGIVERLEESCMPRLAEFGRSLALSNPQIVAETFSHRHAEVVHCLGLNCHPLGTDSLDPRTVALIVNVTAIKRTSMNGYVMWQSPSCHREGQTSVYHAFGKKQFLRFAAELDRLSTVLATAVQRGQPPGSGHNQPMQRTGAAGIISVFRTLLGRGSGR